MWALCGGSGKYPEIVKEFLKEKGDGLKQQAEKDKLSSRYSYLSDTNSAWHGFGAVLHVVQGGTVPGLQESFRALQSFGYIVGSHWSYLYEDDQKVPAMVNHCTKMAPYLIKTNMVGFVKIDKKFCRLFDPSTLEGQAALKWGNDMRMRFRRVDYEFELVDSPIKLDAMIAEVKQWVNRTAKEVDAEFTKSRSIGSNNSAKEFKEMSKYFNNAKTFQNDMMELTGGDGGSGSKMTSKKSVTEKKDAGAQKMAKNAKAGKVASMKTKTEKQPVKTIVKTTTTKKK